MATSRGDMTIVEFIDPDGAVDWSGSAAPVPSQRGPGRRPWLPGAIAVASLIAAGVWLSNSVPDAAPPPTQPTVPVVATTRPTTTSPSEPLFSEGEFLITPPDGMQLEGAWEGAGVTPSELGASEATWATSGANLDQGSWIYIQRSPGDRPGLGIFGEQLRLATPTGVGVLVSKDDTRSMIVASQYTPDHYVGITANGWSIDDVLRVFDAIDHSQPGIALTDSAILGDHQLVSDTGNPWMGTGAGPVAGAWYSDKQGSWISIEISVDTAFGEDIAFDRLLLGEQSPRAIRRIEPYKIVLTGNVEAAVLEQVATTLRQATNVEWNDALRAPATSTNEAAPRTQIGPWVVTTDVEWRVSTWDEFVNVAVKLDDTSVTEIGLGTLGEIGATTAFGFGSSINRTYIAVSSPKNNGPTSLRVSAADGSLVDAPFVDASMVSGAAVALGVIESPGPYIAEVIGADGIVLATWTSDEALQG